MTPSPTPYPVGALVEVKIADGWVRAEVIGYSTPGRADVRFMVSHLRACDCDPSIVRALPSQLVLPLEGRHVMNAI